MEINKLSITPSVFCLILHELVVLQMHIGKMEWKEGLTMGSHLVINGQVNFKVSTHEQGVHEGPDTGQIDYLFSSSLLTFFHKKN